MNEYLTFAHRLADASGVVLKHYFRTPVDIHLKEDETPVTLADREVEAALRAKIEARYPQHGFVGEESGSQRADAEYVWVIDPIDGTRNFMTGNPLCGTLIALIHNGAPILGIIDCPLTGERWVGSSDTGAFLNNQLISVDKTPKPLKDCSLSTTSPYLFNEQTQKGFVALEQHVANTTFGNDCYAYGLVASGHLDIVAESGLQPHDIMALIPVIEASGGMITDWQGQAITLSSGECDVLAATHPDMHREALNLLENTV